MAYRESILNLARAPGTSSVLAVSALLLLVAWSWRLAAVSDDGAAVWAGVTAVSIVCGFAALGWMRPARIGMTAPQVMLLLGALGMVGGLWLDARAGGFAVLASLCLGNPGDFFDILRLHWRQLPAMHLGMTLGGLATVPLMRSLRRHCRRQFCARLAQNLACSAWMIVGMAAGTIAFLRLAAWTGGRGSAAMLGGMFGGMVWGMVASVAMYRFWFWLKDFRDRRIRTERGHAQKSRSEFQQSPSIDEGMGEGMPSFRNER
jgi:hypothetical protein